MRRNFAFVLCFLVLVTAVMSSPVTVDRQGTARAYAVVENRSLPDQHLPSIVEAIKRYIAKCGTFQHAVGVHVNTPMGSVSVSKGTGIAINQRPVIANYQRLGTQQGPSFNTGSKVFAVNIPLLGSVSVNKIHSNLYNC